MTRKNWILALLLLSALPLTAVAQPRFDPQWGPERDDARDLRRAERLLADYDRAAWARDRWALTRVEDEARWLVRQEWEEARAELARYRPSWRDDDRPAVESRTLDRLRAIGERLESLRGRFRPREVAYKRTLIADLARMERDELRRDGDEGRGHHDVRECRHERRHERDDD